MNGSLAMRHILKRFLWFSHATCPPTTTSHAHFRLRVRVRFETKVYAIIYGYYTDYPNECVFTMCSHVVQ